MSYKEYQINFLIRLFIFCTLAFFTYNVANAKTIKVAVIDTGFDFDSTWDNLNKTKFNLPKLCATGHKDFTNTGLNDTHGHGTHIVGLIGKDLKDVDYCIVVLKYYDIKQDAKYNGINTYKAFQYAISIGVDIINYSGGGVGRINSECKLITNALNKGILIAAASGNEHSDLSVSRYYPAMCDNRVMIAANLNKRQIASTSNYDTSNTGLLLAVDGTNMFSLLPNNKYGEMSGTSQSTAIITNKLIKMINVLNNKGAIK